MSRFENEASTRGGGRIVLLAVAGATALVVGQFATSRLGGVTGDVYGAVNELATMAMLVVGMLLVVGTVEPL